MSDSVPDELRELVRLRAGRRCEYCLLHEEDAHLSHEPDHIIAIKHQGSTVRENLAWTCFGCNRHKGTDVASIEAERVVRLFHPRRDRWAAHFLLIEHHLLIAGGSDIGRATVAAPGFNDARPNGPLVARHRAILTGTYPPPWARR